MLLVEVKATQGEADQIILAKNEVDRSRTMRPSEIALGNGPARSLYDEDETSIVGAVSESTRHGGSGEDLLTPIGVLL